jgi:cell wall-associated NlpC family hydrolase
MFITRMMAIAGWAQLPPWQVAQMVQHSGAGAASQGTANYEPSWAPAGAILATIESSATVADCGMSAPGAVPADPTGGFGLPPGYAIPASATPEETVVVAYALAQVGKGYQWGATGPDFFDCSGLTMMAWAQAGVRLDHYTGSQLQEGTAVARYADVSPGDLVLVPGADGTAAAPGHVGLYIGDGLVESAVDPEQGIIVQSWANFTAGGLAGIRHLG